MKKFYLLENNRKKLIFNQVSSQAGIISSAIEKDWWVTLVLKMIFTLPISEYLVFKGGTSLSKGYELIDRFSEDIDLSIDRKYFGYEGELKKKQITGLRKAACKYFSNEFPKLLDATLKDSGIRDYNIEVPEFTDSDTDPVIIELYYESITEKSDYVLPKVSIEIGSRSLVEPAESKPIQSLVGKHFSDSSFADITKNIPIVLPKRTFLEKAFLVHEELQRPHEKIEVDRKSRHLYDLEKLMDTKHGKNALKDKELYESIVVHRKKYYKFGGVDYTTHYPDKINFVPDDKTLTLWRNDYMKMQESMIYGDSLSFEELIERLISLRDKFRKIEFWN